MTNFPGAKSYRYDIEGLRALAVLFVVFYHLDMGLFQGGFVGVDIFFVISGYLITGLIHKDLIQQSFSLKDFYRRRFRRLLPALIAVLLCTTAAAFFVLPAGQLVEFAGSLSSAAFFVANMFFWLNSDYFSVAAEFKPLLHTWSLAVEEQIYMLVPVIMIWVHARFPHHQLGILSLLLLVSLFVNLVLAASDPTAAFFLMPSRAWEFLLGSLLAVFPLRLQNRRLAQGLAAAGLILVVASAVIIDSPNNFYGLYALFPCIGAVLLILTGVGKGNTVALVLASPAMVFFGRISYSLYLWHWPIIALAKSGIQGDLTPLHQGGIFLASLLLATGSYFLIEQPFRQPTRLRRHLTLPSGLVLLLVITAGGLLMRIQVMSGPYGEYLEQVGKNPDYQYLKICDLEDDDLSKLEKCSFGDLNSDNIFLLWGDSHSWVVTPVLNELAHTLGWRGISVAQNGCPALFGVHREDEIGKEVCSGKMAKKVRRFLQSGQVDLVLLVSRWTVYEKGYYINGRLQEQTHFLSDHETRGDDAKTSAVVLERAIDRTLNYLARDLSLPTAVLISVPQLPVPIGKLDPATTVQSRGDYENFRKYTADIFHRYDGKQNLYILDPIEAFCTQVACQAFDGDIPLYGDDNHVTPAGSFKLRPLFRAALEGAGR